MGNQAIMEGPCLASWLDIEHVVIEHARAGSRGESNPLHSHNQWPAAILDPERGL
jgi:hypothetical protein